MIDLQQSLQIMVCQKIIFPAIKLKMNVKEELPNCRQNLEYVIIFCFMLLITGLVIYLNNVLGRYSMR